MLRLHDLVYDFQPSEADAVFERWLAHAADDPTLGYTRVDLAEHIRTEHSTFRWLLAFDRGTPVMTAGLAPVGALWRHRAGGHGY